MDNKVFEMWPKKTERKCSFCGTTEAKAKAMIKSQINDHCICDKCIKQGKVLTADITEK